MTSFSMASSATVVKHQIERQSGDVPLARFGHTCCHVGDSYVVLFGGATGDGGRYTINNDTYLVDVRSNTWKKLDDVGSPSPRAAHCSCCVDNMQMVVYGGATGGGTLSLDEIYLLDLQTFEKDNQFSWMTVPIEAGSPSPGKRYGHSMVYSKPLLIVFGGNNGSQAMNDIWTLDVEKSPFRWTNVSVGPGPCPRVYHSAELCRKGPASGMTVVFGGRTGDNKSLKDAWGLRQHRDGRWDWVEAPAKRGSPPEPRYQHVCLFLESKLIIMGGRGNEASKQLPTSVYDTETCEWKDYTGIERFRHSSWIMGKIIFSYGGFDHKAPSVPTNDLQVIDFTTAPFMLQKVSAPILQQQKVASSATLQVAVPATLPNPPSACVGIASEVYVASDVDVRRVAIGSLEDEGRKLVFGKLGSGLVADRPVVLPQLVDKILHVLLLGGNGSNGGTFFLNSMEIAHLCQSVLPIIQSQPMLLKLRAPIKVYGDLHGQYPDLMRMFSKFGAPTSDGDIDSVDYLFLGDFVDRGSYSLEVICLLFALKCKYPDQIHLIRGNHEDPTINALYGFKDECTRRLGASSDVVNSSWSLFNLVFEYLPCGAIIDGKVLCIHGGIGGSIETVQDIERLERPLKVSQTPQNLVEQKVTDLLWSDPTDSDSQCGILMNETRDPDGSGRILKFGPDRVFQFLNKNGLELIIRAHECVMDGFERFASGKLITVFSATDYCGHHKNAGALLFVRRDMTIIPKLIYPSASAETWDNQITLLRPPTPPRARDQQTIYPLHPINSEQALLVNAHTKVKRVGD